MPNVISRARTKGQLFPSGSFSSTLESLLIRSSLSGSIGCSDIRGSFSCGGVFTSVEELSAFGWRFELSWSLSIIGVNLVPAKIFF